MRSNCVYCGDWYECRDHVIPVSYNKITRDYKIKDVVPCCKECNGYLGSKAYFSVVNRARYLLERYPVKYKKLLKVAEWEDVELESMGYNLRSDLTDKKSMRKVYDLKIANLERVANGFPAKPFNYSNETLDLPDPVIDIFVAIPEDSVEKCTWCGEVFKLLNVWRNGCCSQDCQMLYSRWKRKRKTSKAALDCTITII